MSRYINNVNICSKEIRDDYHDFMENFEDGISLLYDSIKDNKDLDVKKFITRMHTKNLYYFDSKDLKSVSQWQNNTNIMQPHIISIKTAPITEDKKYSDLSLVEDKYLDTIRYPLVSSYSSVSKAFKTSSYPKYLDFKRLMNSIGVIIETAKDSNYSFVESTSYFSFGKSNDKINLRIQIKDYLGGYAVTDQEKTVAVLDQIADFVISKTVKKLEDISNNTLTMQEKCISKIFAVILVNRAINYGDPDVNKSIERCLDLQLCNKLNAMTIDSKRLKTLFNLATKTAEDMLTKMHMTLKDISGSISSRGYTYKKQPSSKIEAVIQYYSQEEYIKFKEISDIVAEIPVTDEIDKVSKIGATSIVDEGKLSNKTSKDNSTTIPEVKLNLNKNAITKKATDKHIDAIVIKNAYKKIQSLSGRLAQAKSDKKQSEIKTQIKILESFVAKYVLQNYAQDSKYSYKLTADLDSQLDKLLTVTLQIKEQILEKLFSDKDRVNNDKKIDISTFINQAVYELYNQKSFGSAFSTLLSRLVINKGNDSEKD